VLVSERPQGTYARQIFLGDALDSERVQADCRLGVLTLTIPVAETAKPRQVPVGGGQETETIVPPPAGGAAASPAERPVSTAG
jgi:HSP20 family protein